MWVLFASSARALSLHESSAPLWYGDNARYYDGNVILIAIVRIVVAKVSD